LLLRRRIYVLERNVSRISPNDFVKKCLLRLVAFVVGHVDPVRDRVGVRGEV